MRARPLLQALEESDLNPLLTTLNAHSVGPAVTQSDHPRCVSHCSATTPLHTLLHFLLILNLGSQYWSIYASPIICDRNILTAKEPESLHGCLLPEDCYVVSRPMDMAESAHLTTRCLESIGLAEQCAWRAAHVGLTLKQELFSPTLLWVGVRQIAFHDRLFR